MSQNHQPLVVGNRSNETYPLLALPMGHTPTSSRSSFTSAEIPDRINPYIEGADEEVSEGLMKQIQKVIKTGIMFSGKPDNAEEFLRELKEALHTCGVKQHDVLKVIPAVLGGKAKVWFCEERDNMSNPAVARHEY
ncbi:hypothetical protein PV327_007404 [Microctonus hyperodae]|uniref:Uncharacterized protein n=1 Tax=Microctonus hyperodae TaxID=165561 RepID=A0AA39FZ42_MICHY|nr:hypothetical protein PV327_007404 [Microctonus hyperodae]